MIGSNAYSGQTWGTSCCDGGRTPVAIKRRGQSAQTPVVVNRRHWRSYRLAAVCLSIHCNSPCWRSQAELVKRAQDVFTSDGEAIDPDCCFVIWLPSLIAAVLQLRSSLRNCRKALSDWALSAMWIDNRKLARGTCACARTTKHETRAHARAHARSLARTQTHTRILLITNPVSHQHRIHSSAYANGATWSSCIEHQTKLGLYQCGVMVCKSSKDALCLRQLVVNSLQPSLQSELSISMTSRTFPIFACIFALAYLTTLCVFLLCFCALNCLSDGQKSWTMHNQIELGASGLVLTWLSRKDQHILQQRTACDSASAVTAAAASASTEELEQNVTSCKSR